MKNKIRIAHDRTPFNSKNLRLQRQAEEWRSGVGVWAGRFHQPEMAVANRLNMDYFTPAMVFTVLANGDFHIREFTWLAIAAALAMFATGLIGYVTARVLNEAPKTVALPIMINNSGNLGIPLALLAFGK